MIPAFDLKLQFSSLRSEIQEAVMNVLDQGQYILGKEVQTFEAEFAQWNGSTHAIGVGNGTDALQIALRSLSIGPGDEVLCPSFTFMATASSIALTGATPVFCDVDADTFGISIEDIQQKSTERTKALIAVHLYGHPAEMDAIDRWASGRGIHVIEDCAQATGAEYRGRKVGNFGAAGCFSFFPTKNLGAAGDAGMIVTNDDALAKRIRRIRAHGSEKKYFHQEVGTNSRLDELQAAILRVKLRYLDEWNARRITIANRYNAGLKHVVLPKVSDHVKHVFHQYTIRSQNRDALRDHLLANQVQSTVYYPRSLHLQEVFSALVPSQELPTSKILQSEVLSLPMFPELGEADQDKVIDHVNAYFVATLV